MDFQQLIKNKEIKKLGKSSIQEPVIPYNKNELHVLNQILCLNAVYQTNTFMDEIRKWQKSINHCYVISLQNAECCLQKQYLI